MEDPYSSFVLLHVYPPCMDVDARLYNEVIDDIRRKQTDLVLENLVSNKLLEKLWDEEATLKSLTFPWISCLYSVLKSVFCYYRSNVTQKTMLDLLA